MKSFKSFIGAASIVFAAFVGIMSCTDVPESGTGGGSTVTATQSAGGGNSSCDPSDLACSVTCDCSQCCSEDQPVCTQPVCCDICCEGP